MRLELTPDKKHLGFPIYCLRRDKLELVVRFDTTRLSHEP